MFSPTGAHLIGAYRHVDWVLMEFAAFLGHTLQRQRWSTELWQSPDGLVGRRRAHGPAEIGVAFSTSKWAVAKPDLWMSGIHWEAYHPSVRPAAGSVEDL